MLIYLVVNIQKDSGDIAVENSSEFFCVYLKQENAEEEMNTQVIISMPMKNKLLAYAITTHSHGAHLHHSGSLILSWIKDPLLQDSGKV